MPINKVVFGSNTLIDISDTTATAGDVASGKYFYAKDGTKTEGTASGESVTVTDVANVTGITCLITTSSEPEPSETWTEIYNNTSNPNADTPYNYLWLSSLSSIYPTVGSKWRLTINGVEYICIAVVFNGLIGVGNPKYSGGTDDGSGCPVCFTNQGWGAWVGDTELPAATPASIKIEQAV